MSPDRIDHLLTLTDHDGDAIDVETATEEGYAGFVLTTADGVWLTVADLLALRRAIDDLLVANGR